MTDLKNGIIDLGDFIITKETTRADLFDAYRNELSDSSTEKRVDFKKAFEILKQLWWCVIYFRPNNQISRLEIIPYGFEYRSEKWDTEGRREERRQFCEGWLLMNLGEPNKKGNGVDYKFDSVQIHCDDYITIKFSQKRNNL